jgi:hypothetical protein
MMLACNGAQGVAIRDLRFWATQTTRPTRSGAQRYWIHKRFDDAEFEIVSAVNARGTDAGCVVWQCATETGQTFEVVPAWPDDERRDAFANATSFIGRMLTVRFSGRTAPGGPRCATGIAVRAEADLPSTI